MYVLYLPCCSTLQINLILKQLEVRVEENTSKPLLALVASAEGSLSNWSSEVHMCVCILLCMHNLCYITFRKGTQGMDSLYGY